MTTEPAFPPNDGQHVGYCTRCGADIFNGKLHRCPKGIPSRVLAVIIAAKSYVEAIEALRCASNGSLLHRRWIGIEQERLAELKAALSAHQEGTTDA
jgi:predicted ATP-dependent serine protease